MAWVKRIFLFLVVNIAILVVIQVIFSTFGIAPYLTPYGLNLKSLFIFAAIFGFAGSFISLFLSKFLAKHMTGTKIIKDPEDPQAMFLVQSVQKFSQQAGIGMPEVGIYPSPEINAFATGWNRNNALVAVSAGLLEKMDKNAIEGVIAHEIGHIQNGDMVTMTLIQGVINTFVIFFARIAAFAVSKFISKDGEDINYIVYFVVSIIFEIIFAILASILVMAFSRWREYGADLEGARLAGKRNMIEALKFLQKHQEEIDTKHKALATMKISDKGGVIKLFMSHPPLQKRIEALQQAPVA